MFIWNFEKSDQHEGLPIRIFTYCWICFEVHQIE